MGNFAAISRNLIARGAACRVTDAASLASEASELLRDSGRRATLGAAAAAWRSENRGAVERTLAVLREELDRRPAD